MYISAYMSGQLSLPTKNSQNSVNATKPFNPRTRKLSLTTKHYFVSFCSSFSMIVHEVIEYPVKDLIKVCNTLIKTLFLTPYLYNNI